MTPQNGKGKRFFTLQEVAKELGMTYRTIHRYGRKGSFKTIRHGGLVRMTREEFNRILTEGF